MSGDKITEIVRKAINILFVSNPKGTSIGVFLGVVIEGVIGLISPFLITIEWISISSVELWHLIGLGVISMNLPEYMRRKKIDPSIKNAIEFIEIEKSKGNISERQARQMYSNLHKKVLESVALETREQKATDRVNLISTNKSADE